MGPLVAHGSLLIKSLSVAITYPLLLLALVLGVALLLGGLAVTGTKRSTNALLSRITDQATERMRLAVVSNLEEPRRLVNLNAQLIRQGVLDPTDVRTMIPAFAAQLDSFTGIGAILVSNENEETMWVERAPAGNVVAIYIPTEADGQCVEWLLEEDGTKSDTKLGSYPYEPRKRPWHIAAVEGPPQGAWTPLYLWATTADPKPIGTGRSKVVRDDSGAFKAILDVGFTVELLSEYLRNVEVTPNGKVFVIDETGRLVATGDPEIPVSMDDERVLAADSDEAIIAKAASAIAKVAQETGGEKFVHSAATMRDGEYYLIDAERLGLDWAPDWTMVTAIPESDLLAQVREVRSRMIFWGACVVVIAVIAGLLFALSIVRPIRGLRRSAGQISAGDLDAAFPGRGGLEFKALAADLDTMRSGLKERLEMRSALAVAMEVQQHLLPDAVPDNSHLDIAAFSTFCDETGGDYYDFPDALPVERIDDGSLLMAIGDVTGHGIAAALIMATARASIRTRLRQGGTLGTVLTDVNEVLAADIPGGRFMTLLAIVLSEDGATFRWTSAGHDPPLMYDPNSDAFHEPDGGGVPLGIIPDADYEEYQAEFGPEGSVMLMGTDGIWETADPNGELYGKERLKAVIQAHAGESADAIGKAVIESLNTYRGSDRPLDDVTMLIVKRRTSDS